jgi:methionine aminotransferase
MIIINTPHNPTGATLSSQDMQELQSIVCQHDLICLSDEVYEHIIFDDARHESVLKYPELRKRSLAVFSFGKTYHATGWKIGYTLANELLSHELRKVHQYNTYCSAAPLQVALARFMKETRLHFDLPKFYQQKRDFFLEQISTTKFIPLKCSGTYFQMLNFSQISSARDVDFATKLTKDFGVASIPISPFYHDKFDPKVLRFCFAKSEATLREAGVRLSKASSALPISLE